MRGPSWSAVILMIVLISTGISLMVQWASNSGRLGALGGGTRASTPEQVAAAERTRTVPQLIGLPSKIAAELLKSRDLLLIVREERSDADMHEGSVLSQEPLPGSELTKGGQVSVVLSAGMGPEAEVPELAGLSVDEAKARLEAAQLSLGDVMGPDAGAPRVVKQSTPTAGEKVEPKTKVSLVMQLDQVEVPRVTGLNVRKAKKALEAAGLKLGKVRVRFDDLRPYWAVLAQDPEAGEKIAAGSEVDLVRNEE